MGKRRARCLRQLGFDDIAAFDPRDDRRDEIARESGVTTYGRFKDALRDGADLALVCAPPHQHLDCALRSIDALVPVFCEAPLALTLESADQIVEAAAAAGLFLAPSCTYLHNRIHRAIKDILDNDELGRPLSAVSYVGQHAADWHPYEDYRDFYVSKRSEGGMCFDMFPHELQLFSHFFGDPRSLSCMARRRSRDIDAEECACDVYDVLLDMSAGVSLVLHQDVVQRPFGEYRKIVCERGAIEWTWHNLRVARYRGPQGNQAPQWEDITPADSDFEQMYADELTHVIHCLQSGEPYLVTPRRERQILAWALACEESSRTGTHIPFE